MPSWMRVTRNFINIIRKQYLLWRTFTAAQKDAADKQAAAQTAAANVVTVQAQQQQDAASTQTGLADLIVQLDSQLVAAGVSQSAGAQTKVMSNPGV